jgi:N-methylhydantoinase A/acetophenone carboxylase
VCFADAIGQSASTVGLELSEFLRRSSVIRFSSTIGTNTVLTHSGPKLGLLVTGGDEGALYGAAADDLIFQFVPADMVAGLAERVSEDGQVELAPDPEAVGVAARGLLERGARILVVSLRNAASNPANEEAVLDAIDASYPRHYLGAVPTLLSTQVSAVADDASRTASAVVNAYMHKRLALSLYRAEDDLRREAFRHPLLVVTAGGTVNRVAKTRALSTFQSGPAAGVHAGALLCRAHGIETAITADVGGTSTDLGVVAGGRPVDRRSIDVGGLDVAQPSVEVLSIAVGGGSICAVDDGQVRVGPESAAAIPGPACYGLGGRNPTPTDAWLVLGYLDPDSYLGGRRRLKPDAAIRALEERIGGPLGLPVEEAALAVKEAAERAATAGVRQMVEKPSVRGAVDGRAIEDLAMVAYGGGGGILLPAAAWSLGMSTVFLSSLSSVFSAFGVSTFDVRHRYEARVRAGDTERVEAAIEALVDAARRDIRGEGFDEDAAVFSASAEVDDGRVLAQDVHPAGLAAAIVGSGVAAGDWLTVALSAACEVAKPGLPQPETAATSDPAAAEIGRRDVVVGVDDRRNVPVYSWERLLASHRIHGPSVIETGGSTYLIPESTSCEVDGFGAAVLERED